VGTFGVRGEIKLLPSSVGEDAVREGITATLRFDDGRTERAFDVVAARRQKRVLIVVFSGVASANDAQALVGGELWTERANAALSDNEYLDSDLVGCALLERDRTIGTVRSVHHYPAQDVLELDGGALVPLVRAFVREIDVQARVIRVELPPGLVEGEAL